MTVSRPRQNTPRLRPPSPRRGFSRRRGGAPNLILSLGATSWYDGLSGLSGQTWTALVSGQVGTLGSTAGVDTNDPTIVSNGATFDGTDDYVSLTAAETPTYDGASGDWSMLACVTSVPGNGSSDLEQIFNSVGLAVFNYLGGLYVRSGTTGGGATFSSTFSAGVRTVVGVVVTSGAVQGYRRGSSLTTPPAVGVPSHTNPFLGMNRGSISSGFGWNGTIHGVALFNNIALSQANMDLAADYLYERYV